MRFVVGAGFVLLGVVVLVLKAFGAVSELTTTITLTALLVTAVLTAIIWQIIRTQRRARRYAESSGRS
ncbi:hypothetical protein [Leucobacter tardus]|uniref:Uncharacterized protein n=1 Tax=Leucobacter tardus TaxID=501483 RepID=A0A939QD58_9MICO|nr:hypothetical protein [Leucobacter tardus]MBO2988660.1 hypothetical protein [Leucobacter tardus]